MKQSVHRRTCGWLGKLRENTRVSTPHKSPIPDFAASSYTTPPCTWDANLARCPNDSELCVHTQMHASFHISPNEMTLNVLPTMCARPFEQALIVLDCMNTARCLLSTVALLSLFDHFPVVTLFPSKFFLFYLHRPFSRAHAKSKPVELRSILHIAVLVGDDYTGFTLFRNGGTQPFLSPLHRFPLLQSLMKAQSCP